VAPPLLKTFTRGVIPIDPDAGAGTPPLPGAPPALTAG